MEHPCKEMCLDPEIGGVAKAVTILPAPDNQYRALGAGKQHLHRNMATSKSNPLGKGNPEALFGMPRQRSHDAGRPHAFFHF